MQRIPYPALVIPAVLLLSLVVVPLSYGRGSFPGSWGNKYPNSTSDDNAAAAGSVCYLCHTPNGTSTWNPYGNALKRKIDGGMSLFSAMGAVESENSDGDVSVMPSLPDGWTNIMEITNNAQPGWTNGDVPYYDADGNVLGTMTAPSGMTPLDPAESVEAVPVTWGRLKTVFPR